ncbi:Homocysteine S-methyltransferase 1 [Podila humilis]|nr:Homocysteine S-methyltransferase 1 [Podila humilis]
MHSHYQFQIKPVGRIRLGDLQRPWREHPNGSAVHTTHLLLLLVGLGFLTSAAHAVTLLTLYLQHKNGNPAQQHPVLSARSLISPICCVVAWTIHGCMSLQERIQPHFSPPVRFFWCINFLLSSTSFALWAQGRIGLWADPLAFLTKVIVIARFVLSICIVLAGILQEYQFRSTSYVSLENATFPSSRRSNTTLVDHPVPSTSPKPNGKQVKVKVKSEPTLTEAQKDYQRPTTLRAFYAHIKHLRPFLWPSKSKKLQIHILLCLVLLVAGRVVNVAVPTQVRNVVNALKSVEDGAEGGKDEFGNPRFVWKEIMIFIAFRALQGSIGVVDTTQSLLWIPVGQFNTRELAVRMFEHLLNLSLRFHLNRKTGEMLRVQDRGVSSIVTLLSSLLFNIIPCLVDITVACIVLTSSFDIYFGIIVFVTMMCYIYATILMTDWRTRYRRESNALDNAVEARAVDSLLNYETIKLFATEEFEVGKYMDAIQAYQKADQKSQYTLAILNTTLNLVIQGGLALGCLLCAKRVAQKEMEVGEFVMYYAYILQLYGPLNTFGSSYRSLQKNFIDMEKMLDLFKEPVEIQDLPDSKPLVMTKGEVVFENVSFGYNPMYPNVKSVSFTIPHGKKLALVGPSGGGKSTILKLLFRFYDPTIGRILIDGQDIRTVTQTSLRRRIGIVPQDTALFNETIGYNIGYGKIGQDRAQVFDPSRSSLARRRSASYDSSDNGNDHGGVTVNGSGCGSGYGSGPRRVLMSGKPIKQTRGRKSKNGSPSTLPETQVVTECDGDADIEVDGADYNDNEDWQEDGRIQAAAEAARIHEIITRFPEGYRTRVGERGMRLSGGEKQRVAIARTILKNPAILLLDEATSALDTQTEREIQNSIESISKDRTTLMIAHRLSTIVDADEILVIQQGQIAEQGSHEELMRAGGIYAAMWMQQLREDRTPSLGSSQSSQKDSSKGEEEESEEDDSSDEDVPPNRIRIRRPGGRYCGHHHHGSGHPSDHKNTSRKMMSHSLPAYAFLSGGVASRPGSESGSRSGTNAGAGVGAGSGHDFSSRQIDHAAVSTLPSVDGPEGTQRLDVLDEVDHFIETMDNEEGDSQPTETDPILPRTRSPGPNRDSN